MKWKFTTILWVVIPPVALFGYEELWSLAGQLGSGRAVSLAGLDKALFGFDVPLAAQKAFTSHIATVVFTWFYGIHLPLILFAIGLFFFTNRTLCKGYVGTMILTSYLGLITFFILPTSPPWFTGPAHNLLVSRTFPHSIRGLARTVASGEADKFAAFPSLHAAYVVLFAVYSFRLDWKVGIVASVIAAGVLFSTIYLGQHYVIDLIGGTIYALVSVFAVDRLLKGERT